MTSNTKRNFTVAFTDDSEDLLIESTGMTLEDNWVIFEDAAWVPAERVKYIASAPAPKSDEGKDKPTQNIHLTYAGPGRVSKDLETDIITASQLMRHGWVAR